MTVRSSKIRSLGEARQIIGAPTSGMPFGKTSKMPGYSYGLDAFRCQRGSVLADDPDSPCASCYARRNFYATWGPVIESRRRHQEAVERFSRGDNPLWPVAMVLLIERYLRPLGERFFRFHDSGDLVSEVHLLGITHIAQDTPWLRYWLPTHEPTIVTTFVKFCGRRAIPPNLVIRISADRNDEAPPYRLGFPTSTTHHEHVGAPRAHRPLAQVVCRAHVRDNECRGCRACWSPDVDNVSYPLSGGAAAATRAEAAKRARRSSALRVIP